MKSTKLTIGIILLAVFAVILLLIFMPIFGGGQNGLSYSDNFFNSLAKGSSNYFANMRKLAQTVAGTQFDAEIKMTDPAQAKETAALYSQAGAQAEVAGPNIKISGDLGKVLLQSVEDADLLFNEQGGKLEAQYHYDPKKVVKNWWSSFNKLAAAMTKQKKFDLAKAITQVQARALEPGYNFSGIVPYRVSDKAVLLGAMLVFYIFYTLFYGFGIYELFAGLGLQMEKSTKEEV
jgi:predicted metalloprotease with PDZ domain